MNKKIVLVSIITLCLIIIGCLYFWIIPSKKEKESKERIYLDLKDKVENAKKSVVGIIPENKEKDGFSHNGIGSGVIFEKVDNTYYVITAGHVVEEKNDSYKIFTINTKFSGETIKADDNVSFEIPDETYYDSLLSSKIEYISENLDLAIISFKTEEELPILKFETNRLKVGDKIVAIGHPEGNRYATTYGNITSDIKSATMITKGTNNKKTDKVMEHNAYLNFGNSGGVAISENMKIAGINIGGSFNILGYFKNGVMIPSDIVQNTIKEWKNKI